MYPRRYFDDMVLEQRITEQQINSQFSNMFKGTSDASKVFQEMMSSQLPFGKVSGKKLKAPNALLNEESGVTLHPKFSQTTKFTDMHQMSVTQQRMSHAADREQMLKNIKQMEKERNTVDIPKLVLKSTAKADPSFNSLECDP